jgi:two-component system nitrate/nitrite response regulator NarL
VTTAEITTSQKGGLPPLNILIVDDHRLFAEGLRSALRERGMESVAIAVSGREAIAMARARQPDMVLLDLALPDLDGLTVGQRILADHPGTRILALSGLDDASLARDALRDGFRGYLLKHASLSDLVGAILAATNSQMVIPQEVARAMLEGERDHEPADQDPEALLARQLTRREREILALLAAGASGKEIAAELFLSPNTVRTHVQNVLTKLQVHSRLEAVAFAARHGLSVRLAVSGNGGTLRSRRPRVAVRGA